MKTIVATLLLSTITLLSQNWKGTQLNSNFVWAIWSVESSNSKSKHIVGDNGKAWGPLQIHKACWADARLKGEYKDCFKLDYSVKVMESYLNRYCKDAVKSNNFEIMARVWNGGVGGIKNSKTDNYWKKVKSILYGPHLRVNKGNGNKTIDKRIPSKN